jgi:hypothetical protein
MCLPSRWRTPVGVDPARRSGSHQTENSRDSAWARCRRSVILISPLVSRAIERGDWRGSEKIVAMEAEPSGDHIVNWLESMTMTKIRPARMRRMQIESLAQRVSWVTDQRTGRPGRMILKVRTNPRGWTDRGCSAFALTDSVDRSMIRPKPIKREGTMRSARVGGGHVSLSYQPGSWRSFGDAQPQQGSL